MSDERTIGASFSLDNECGRRHADLLTDAEFIWSVLANSSEAIQVLDREARIQFISASALSAFQIDDGDALIGTSWLALWRDGAGAQAAAAVEAANAGRTGSFEASRVAAGKQTWWDVTVAPIRGGGGEPTRLLVLARDATQRRMAHSPHLVTRQELHHRIKNTLAMAMAITSQSLARAPSLDEGRRVVERRLMALADIHSLLHESGSDGVSLREIIERAIAPYDSAPTRFAVAGDDMPLSVPSALAIGMAFHELSTNAVKHGTLAAKGGQVEISWRVDAETGRVHFVWRERGGLDMWAPIRPGFGMRIIEASFRDQLGGRVEASLEPSGLLCALEAPLAAVRETTRQDQDAAE